VITDAQWSMSADISYRQRRYLIMMGIRVACFLIAVLVFVYHGGWLVAFPLVGAVAIPYFAVVFANGGREPAGRRAGFQEYQPNLPQPFVPPPGGQPDDAGRWGTHSPGSTDGQGSTDTPRSG
jgi:hypothetical protein